MDSSALVVVASSRRFRRICVICTVLMLVALVVSVWLGVVVAYSLATVMTVSTESFLAIYLIIMARSRLAMTPEEFQMWWPRSAAGPRIRWASVTAVEVRRGLFLEKIQITADRPQVLFAPIRFRHRHDPVFDEALAELSRRSGCEVRPAPPRPYPHLVVSLWILWVACLAFLAAMNAPWNDPSWPWRHEADRLPDTCAGFAATARTLLPGGERTPDADLFLLGPIESQDGCTWRKGTVDTFSIGLGLARKEVFRSASSTACDGFRRTVDAARHPDRSAVPVAGLGDEAQQVTDGAGDQAAVDMIARKANVVITVRLITTRPGGDSARTVEQVARAALSKISFN
ncbi:MAG: hypothetical protein ACRDP6_48555 [Actinoallomurus sp.]